MKRAGEERDSRSRFLDAALHVIRTKGYSATRVEDLCDAAGLTKGSFFHHFASKDDLALAAVAHFAATAERRLAAEEHRRAVDPLERLLRYVDFRRSLLRGPVAEFTCLLGTMVQEVYETNPTLRAACEKHLSAGITELARDIVEAKRLYAPDAPWNAESLATFVEGTMQGAFVLAKAKGGARAAADCLTHLHRYLETQFDRSRHR